MIYVLERGRRIFLVSESYLGAHGIPLLMTKTGLAVGGAWGLQEGMARSLGKNASFKLRLNSVLNGSTRRGTLLGNSLGVLGELLPVD